MDPSHIVQNDAERERLRTLAGQLTDEDLARPLPGGWTVAALLAHLAFWDRFVLARWRRHLHDGPPIVSLPDQAQDFVNEAGMEQWLALPRREAARQAVAAAEEVDRAIAQLPPEAVEAAHAKGSRRLLDRSAHRREHLDEIERALAR